MRYTDKDGNTLSLNECMTADSFFMEADVYISEPLEMHFNEAGELSTGKKPQPLVGISAESSSPRQ